MMHGVGQVRPVEEIVFFKPAGLLDFEREIVGHLQKIEFFLQAENDVEGGQGNTQGHQETNKEPQCNPGSYTQTGLPG